MTAVFEASLPAVRAFRMARQHLTSPSPPGTMLEAVTAVHGIQSQVDAHAVFAVGQRVASSGPDEIRRALWQDRTLVKTWAMRGTLHWLPRDEEPLYVSALSDLRSARMFGWMARDGHSRAQVDQFAQQTMEALDGKALTRREIADVVIPSVGDWIAPYLLSSWGSGMGALCSMGLVVFGPPRGGSTTFVRRDQWMGDPPSFDPSESRCELLRRYLRAFGPATMQDFAYWLGIPNRDIADVWAAVSPELATVSVEGKARWVLAEDVDALALATERKMPVRLLPAFDPLMLAHRGKSDHLDMRHHKRVYGAAAWVYPVVLVEGVARATWSYKRTSSRLTLTVKPFSRLNQRVMKAVERDARRLGAVVGLEGTVEASD